MKTKRRTKTEEQIEDNRNVTVTPRIPLTVANEKWKATIGKNCDGGNDLPVADFLLLAERCLSLYKSFGIDEFYRERHYWESLADVEVINQLFWPWVEYLCQWGRIEEMVSIYPSRQFLQIDR